MHITSPLLLHVPSVPIEAPTYARNNSLNSVSSRWKQSMSDNIEQHGPGMVTMEESKCHRSLSEAVVSSQAEDQQFDYADLSTMERWCPTHSVWKHVFNHDSLFVRKSPKRVECSSRICLVMLRKLQYNIRTADHINIWWDILLINMYQQIQVKSNS